MITKELQKFSTILPEECQTAWKQLFADTIDNQQPLMVCLAGRQGLGKTSLINTLLGECLLPVGETSLDVPVHFIYGQHFQVHFVDTDGTSHKVEQATQPAILTQPPATCKYVDVTAPQDWLRNIELVDLPRQTELGERYLGMADAIVYLIPSVGPDDEDMALIQNAVAAGLRVWVGVSLWDEVETEAAKGRCNLPDIQPWEQQIQTATGQDISVIPVSQKGTGKFALITFLKNMAQACNGIRENRLHTAGIPLLFSFFEKLLQEKQHSSNASKEAINKLDLYERLLKEKDRKIEELSLKIEKLSDKIQTVLAEKDARIYELEKQNKDVKEKDSKINELFRKIEELSKKTNTILTERDAKIRDLDQQNKDTLKLLEKRDHKIGELSKKSEELSDENNRIRKTTNYSKFGYMFFGAFTLAIIVVCIMFILR